MPLYPSIYLSIIQSIYEYNVYVFMRVNTLRPIITNHAMSGTEQGREGQQSLEREGCLAVSHLCIHGGQGKSEPNFDGLTRTLHFIINNFHSSDRPYSYSPGNYQINYF